MSVVDADRDVVYVQQFWEDTHNAPYAGGISIIQLTNLLFLRDREEFISTGIISCGRNWKKLTDGGVYSPELQDALLKAEKYQVLPGVVIVEPGGTEIPSEWAHRVCDTHGPSVRPLDVTKEVRHLPEVLHTYPGEDIFDQASVLAVAA